MDSSESEERGTWLDRLTPVILQLTVSLMLLCRGFLTWRWDSPIRELIWQEKWWTPVLQKWDVTWSHFARTSDEWITPTLERLGIFLMVMAVVPWLGGFSRLRWTRWFLIPATLVLILDAFSRWVGKDMQAGMFMEYALQVTAPVALLIYLGRKSFHAPKRDAIVKWILIFAAGLTFVGHGLYAMGYYNVPLKFRMMTTEILPISEEGSLMFLEIAGWLDFVVVGLVLLPWTRTVALIYMVLWGGATALARVLTYYDTNLPYNGLDPWLAETLVRTPHWAVPLWILWLIWRARVLARTEDPVQS